MGNLVARVWKCKCMYQLCPGDNIDKIQIQIQRTCLLQPLFCQLVRTENTLGPSGVQVKLRLCSRDPCSHVRGRLLFLVWGARRDGALRALRCCPLLQRQVPAGALAGPPRLLPRAHARGGQRRGCCCRHSPADPPQRPGGRRGVPAARAAPDCVRRGCGRGSGAPRVRGGPPATAGAAAYLGRQERCGGGAARSCHCATAAAAATRIACGGCNSTCRRVYGCGGWCFCCGGCSCFCCCDVSDDDGAPSEQRIRSAHHFIWFCWTACFVRLCTNRRR